MNLTGRITDGDLVLRRELAAPIEDVWASVTESERLARWFGTWTGDPAEGHVTVTMNAEAEPGSPTRYDIHRCDRPHRLSVSATDEYGTWLLDLDLSHADGRTTLVLTQRDVAPSGAHEVGPGWEWYLDRLESAVEDVEPPTLEAFDQDYLPLGDLYRSMLSD
ncbi:SRPBCC family protein [Actinomarinicola tropica]|uniref:Activator of Hsp90 ATPase homologue 1/2-like C-terminal domain-containing protein n=1 Tax=Actinomarinicola tropica TaxID=2789776 RepID=A0A5Q2RBN3_9ACTN|nr:SRPBCC family protein [Actinomarinicola tropica]QGG94238.1 hypothetical protein GH723_03495 [Actinomarinicola tropica]